MEKDNLKFTKNHIWVLLEDNLAYIGISSYAIEELGNIVHLELPVIGANFAAEQEFATVESTKTVSDLYMPVDCTILDINEEILQNPENLFKFRDKNIWLIKIKIKSTTDMLLNEEQYNIYIGKKVI